MYSSIWGHSTHKYNICIKWMKYWTIQSYKWSCTYSTPKSISNSTYMDIICVISLFLISKKKVFKNVYICLHLSSLNWRINLAQGKELADSLKTKMKMACDGVSQCSKIRKKIICNLGRFQRLKTTFILFFLTEWPRTRSE